MAAPKGGSRERLLDAAEQLFAERGFDATSTRDIAARAGDTLGTLSHHFGSKDGLLAEVIRRRFDALAEMRRDMYQQIQQLHPRRKPTLDEVIACIVVPFVERGLRGDSAWRSYITLLGRMMYSREPNHYRMIAELTDPLATEMLGWLAKAAPETSAVDRGYAYQFLVGALVDSCAQVEHDRLRRITSGACSAFDYDEISVRLLRFITAGFRAVLGMPPSRRLPNLPPVLARGKD
jgi:AcrR family transcriptional regulator